MPDVQQHQGAIVRAEASRAFRRVTLIVAIVIIALELGMFWVAARLIPAPTADGTAHQDLVAVFVVFWTMLTLQAMAAVGLGWMLVAIGRTRLAVEDGRIAIGHPWRSWGGSGADIVELYTSRGWLHLRPRGCLRTWHLRAGDARADVLDALRAIVPADAQLTERAARRLMVARTAGPWLIAVAVGMLVITILQRWLQGLR